MDEPFTRPFAPTRLILGKMPPGSRPENVLAAGPWCFAGQEDIFPDWDTRFHFAPEPLCGDKELEAAVLAAQGLCIDNVKMIARELCDDAARLPDVYWRTLLIPWLINVCRQIVERGLRAAAMAEAWRDAPLTVPVIEDTPDFNFLDEQDFTLRGSLGLKFNFWLFSLLLAPIWPTAWKKVKAAPADYEEKCEAPRKEGALGRTGREINHSLYFPRLKGMSLAQAIKFSLALLHPCRKKDRSLDLDVFSARATGVEIRLGIDPAIIFKAALPQSMKNLRHPRRISQKGKPYLRIANVSMYENARYRQKLAVWRAKGGRLGFVQHGGNYGQIAVSCDRQLVEYSQDAFFTWGWKKHGSAKGDFIPLPYPQLQNLKNKRRNIQDGKLIFVGAEMPAYGYRLESRPTPLQTLEYRRDKALFFEALGEDLRSLSFYRPYFNLPGILADAAWLLPRFPSLRLCAGCLMPQILECSLLVLDHHGTTMLEAFVADVPVVLFWRSEAWPLCPEAAALRATLQKAGIWRDSPQDAARHIKRIWPHAAEWWHEPAVQEARLAYCSRQALTVKGDADACWISTLKTL